jgi:glycosyltransferase involved in cell wall biosynthesis
LQAQTYPANKIEVVVVSDGGTDGTVDALSQVETAFPLKVIDQPKSGAAVARNAGASIASGTILIFLDDDIEASPGLVEAHVKAHHDATNRVIIGYLPPVIYCEHEFFGPAIREWWEMEFDSMRHKSHRFQFKNLTSGNFSIHKTLFIEVGGLTSILCARKTMNWVCG